MRLRSILTAAVLLAVPAAFGQDAGLPPAITTPNQVNTRLGTLNFPNGIPTAETADKVYDQLDYIRGVDTFLNSFGGVSMYAIRKGFREAGVQDNSVLIFSGLMDSKSLFLTANCDTIYFWGYLDLSHGPLVVEVPPDSLGIFDDMWFRWIGDFGAPGPDRGEGGKYLLLPPGYKGPLPDGGFYVYRSRTNGVGAIGAGLPREGRPQASRRANQEAHEDLPLRPWGRRDEHRRFSAGQVQARPPGDADSREFRRGDRAGDEHRPAERCVVLRTCSMRSCRMSRPRPSIPRLPDSSRPSASSRGRNSNPTPGCRRFCPRRRR